MDNLQAAILNYRLKNLKKIIKSRRINVQNYIENLNFNHVKIPLETKDQFNTYHTFVIQVNQRDELKKYLEKNGIGTAIHYPVPIHLQKCSKLLGYKKGDFPITESQSKKIITLPIHQDLKKNDIIRICKLVNKFVK